MQVVWGRHGSSRVERKDYVMEGKDLLEFFDKALFISNLKAKTKEKSFNELAKLFVKTKFIRKKDIVLEMLLEREKLGSTGIGKGVAIPHGRTTAAIDVKIAFGKSEEGIDFNSVDKKPVHLVFMVIAPTEDEDNVYLSVLGKLVEIVNDRKNRNKLLKSQTYEEFITVFDGAN